MNAGLTARDSACPRFPGAKEWIAFGVALASLWPGRVIVRSDDFGYLESVANTIRQGKLVASDWLEPFNFVLPELASALWQMSGSFYVATMGLMAGIALLNFGLMWCWLRPLLPPGLAGNVAVLAGALCPVVLNKTVEFTGIPLGFTLFLAALLAWRGQRPVWFYTFVLVGFMNRQSAAVLLTLPVVAQLGAWRRGDGIGRGWVAGGLVVAGVIAVVMYATPASLARAIAGRRQAEIDLLRLGGQLLLGAGLLGGFAAGWALLRGERESLAGRGVLARPWPVLGWLILGAALASMGITELQCETPGWWRLGLPITVLAVGLAAGVPAGLGRVDLAALVTAALYGMLVAWRGVWWDYYLVEPALLLASARARQDDRRTPPLALGGSLALLAAGLLWLAPLGRQLRWAETRDVAYEEALRAGRVEISLASEAPFGFLGWKVFPALIERRQQPDLRLIDFVKYVEAGRSFYARGGIVVMPAGPERRSLDGSGELWPLPAGYRPRPFPLNDAEWRQWLASPQP